jgi:hypothetical protein
VNPGGEVEPAAGGGGGVIIGGQVGGTGEEAAPYGPETSTGGTGGDVSGSLGESGIGSGDSSGGTSGGAGGVTVDAGAPGGGPSGVGGFGASSAGAPGGSNEGGSPYLFVINPRKILVPVTREFSSYNMKPFGRAANSYAFQASKVPTLALAIPAAVVTASALGREMWTTGSLESLGEFGAELSGLEGSPPSPSTAGSLGVYWHLYGEFLLMPEPPGSAAYWDGP